MDDDDEDLGEVIVCQGPPRCPLEDEAAIAAQEAGCIWCIRIAIHSDGTETVTEPVSC